jgi:thiol:disulfide interchange protein DsbD
MTGTFFSGVLATVVATPCSGPFLGTAIGAAIGLPATQFFTAFTVMAIGLSLPYLILSVFPELVDYLPRPGPWMETFKQGMSFLLFATAGYLLWVYGGIIDFDNLLNPIIGLTLVAVGLWIYGRWSGLIYSKRTRVTSAIVALLAVIGGIYYSGNIKKGLDWQPWSEVAVEQSLVEGKPVYVDFTAKWCLTCQLNKKVAYTEEVIELFNQYGIVPMKADKTKPSPQIEKALNELKRTAIPVNVLYIPGKDPIITPETLTPGYMKELIEKNVPKKDAK